MKRLSIEPNGLTKTYRKHGFQELNPDNAPPPGFTYRNQRKYLSAARATAKQNHPATNTAAPVYL
ncbi:MAG: hypothetical protein MK364_15470 [Pirellulales bacterium]|nr:hypothetical protein [Pirellulales bacterium]